MNSNYVTMEAFEGAMSKIDEKFVTNETFRNAMERIDGHFADLKNELKEFMMEGFTKLDQKIDYINESFSSEIDELKVSKADREEVFALHKKIAKIEKKIA